MSPEPVSCDFVTPDPVVVPILRLSETDEAGASQATAALPLPVSKLRCRRLRPPLGQSLEALLIGWASPIIMIVAIGRWVGHQQMVMAIGHSC